MQLISYIIIFTTSNIEFSICIFLTLCNLFYIKLQNDNEVVIEYSYLLKFTSKELYNDIEIVLEAVISNGTALEFTSHELKNDKEVVLEAINSTIVVEYYLDVHQFASKKLLKDKKIV